MTTESTHVPQQEVATLDALFRARAQRTPDGLAYRQFDQETNSWQEFSWQQTADDVALWQAAMLREPLEKGDRIGIMLANCREWVCCEQAALGLGLVVVPLYNNDRPDNISFILQDAGIKLLLCQGREHWEQMEPIHAQLSGLARIVMLEGCDEIQQQHPRLLCTDEWLPPNSNGLQSVDKSADDLASIVYTSGTTGRPKGVMLSHQNILFNAYAGAATAELGPEDSFLSFLPLSHMLERTAGYYIPMITGASVSYARSVLLLAEDLLTIKPTALVSVPRIFERVYSKLSIGLAEKSSTAQRLFHLAVETGWQRFLYQQGRAGWQVKLLLWPLLNKLVASKLMEKLGGRLKIAICGGAPLSSKVAKTFIALGLNLRQGYGLTETSPVISVNRDNNNHPSSVGEALEGIEVKIGEDDELLTRGPCVMHGYWNNAQATRDMIDGEGWLHTGDKAKIENGIITITGRIKEIIVLSNGEKIPPADMEMAITMDPLFEQVMVLGEGRPYLSLLAVLNQEQTIHEKLASGSDEDNALILERIANQLKDFPGYAQIRRVHICTTPWTIEDGLITPTLKLKRDQLLSHYSKEINELYEGH